MIRYFTDYPITALGDTRGRRAQIRRVEVKRVCGDWCQIILHEPRIELHIEVPVDRIYCRKPGRYAVPISDRTIYRINAQKR